MRMESRTRVGSQCGRRPLAMQKPPVAKVPDEVVRSVVYELRLRPRGRAPTSLSARTAIRPRKKSIAKREVRGVAHGIEIVMRCLGVRTTNGKRIESVLRMRNA